MTPKVTTVDQADAKIVYLVHHANWEYLVILGYKFPRLKCRREPILTSLSTVDRRASGAFIQRNIDQNLFFLHDVVSFVEESLAV
jgi:hypothetical protein